MTNFELPFVDAQRGRDGLVRYWYFRRNGQRWRLPGTPSSQDFMNEYWRLIAETEPSATAERPSDRRDYLRGTFGALVNDYLATGEFKTNLAPRTQAEYRRICEGLQERHGQKPVARLERRHVRQMRDEKAETPGAANSILRMLKILLNFAVDDGLIQASPAAKMKELKVGEWRSWTDEECAAFEKRWAPGTMQRRAYALAIYTGQRLSDLVAMTRQHRKDGCIHVVAQAKTGEELWIAEHRELTAELARGVAGINYLLTTPTQGKPFSTIYFGSWMAEAIDDAGLPDDCVTHGLRKVAARKLREAGCTEQEIMDVTGHTTSRMVAKYTKGADRKKGAKAAIGKLENAK
jgi:integrase